MKLTYASALDRKRWDALVEKHHADVFSYSWYLDACASDWCVVTDDGFDNGIALPFTVKLGVKAISPPIFIRNLDFIGNNLDFQQKALEWITKEFKVGHLQLSNRVGEPADAQHARVFQAVTETPVLHTQARRMVQKALKNGITIAQTQDWQPVFDIIRSELSEKISEFTAENLQKLQKLIASLEKENKLLCLGIYRDGQLQGGMIFMDSVQKRVYLKGAAQKQARDLGGMYLCMNESIRQTVAENRAFDFGGSGVDGVRRFNLNLGGTDSHYYIYSWNHAPWWFNFTKWIYQQWKKK